jgi:hypothetical protein
MALAFTAMQNSEQSPLMQRDALVGSSHGVYFDKLRAYADEQGITVKLVKEPRNADGELLYGRFFYLDKILELQDGLPVNALVSTMAHELGHYLEPLEIRANKDKKDVFAETVAAGYCAAIGLESWNISYFFLQSYPTPADTIREYETQIDTAVKILVDASR